MRDFQIRANSVWPQPKLVWGWLNPKYESIFFDTVACYIGGKKLNNHQQRMPIAESSRV
jgi:hypothetical protein